MALRGPFPLECFVCKDNVPKLCGINKITKEEFLRKIKKKLLKHVHLDSIKDYEFDF